MSSLFRKWSPDDLAVVNQLKSSAARTVRNDLAESFSIPGLIDSLLPRGTPLRVARGSGGSHVRYLLDASGEVLFVAERDQPWMPTLRLVHRYPSLLPRVQVDRGAIKFVLSGADVMCPGLTSAGGALPEAELAADTIVAVFAEGKQHALAVGRLLLSTTEIREQNKGHGIANLHQLGDGLYMHGQDVKK